MQAARGEVERAAIVDGSRVAAGDVVIGLASSGLHSNGYSLVRKVIEHSSADADTRIDGEPLYDVVMRPTRIYVKSCLALLESVDVHAFAHITGGGLPENLPRVLPEGLGARIDAAAWPRPAIFDWLQREGQIATAELYRTFNCGVGMVAVVSAPDSAAALEALTGAGETARVIGTIVEDEAHGVTIDSMASQR
ncbi:MAG: phosphoribosylformylglycinamidine cyclo-ligase [Pseudomonadota bacterium]